MVNKKERHHNPMDTPRYAQVVIGCILAAATIVCLYPFLNVFAKSLSEAHAIYTNPTMIVPHSFTLEAYEYIFSTSVLLKSFAISVFSTVVGTILNLLFTIPTA